MIFVISFLSEFVRFDTYCSSARIVMILIHLFIALELEHNFINKKSLQSHADFTIGRKKFVTNALE